MVWEGVSGVQHDSCTMHKSSCIHTHSYTYAHESSYVLWCYDESSSIIRWCANLEELVENYDDLVLYMMIWWISMYDANLVALCESICVYDDLEAWWESSCVLQNLVRLITIHDLEGLVKFLCARPLIGFLPARLTFLRTRGIMRA
jgi:hypothetical protein